MPEFIPRPFAHFDWNKTELCAQLTASPPYDVLSKEERDFLANQSPCNIVHIDLPNEYEDAAEILKKWLEEGSLKIGPKAMYLLSSSYTPEPGQPACTRYAIFGGMRVSPWGEDGVHPHEKTYPKAKTDRMCLMRATKAQLSPIFGIFNDPELDLPAMEKALAEKTPPLCTYSSQDEAVHSLWMLPQEAADLVSASLKSAQVYIADGHHRYETALAYKEEIRAGDNDPAAFVFAGMANLASGGVRILPYHRIVSGLENFNEIDLLKKAESFFQWREVSSDNGDSPFDESDAEAAFILQLKDKAFVFSIRQELIPTLNPQIFARIGAYIVDEYLFKKALKLNEEDLRLGRYVKHIANLENINDELKAGNIQAAIILRPVAMEIIREVAHLGLTMPRKSTYFHPKLPTGLLIHLLNQS